MARHRNPFLMIPVFLNLVTVTQLITTFPALGFLRGSIVAVAALGAPWLLYFLIGRIVTGIVKEIGRKRKNDEDHEFI